MLPLVHDDVHGGVVVVNVVGGPCVAELREQVGKPAHGRLSPPMHALVTGLPHDHRVVPGLLVAFACAARGRLLAFAFACKE